MRSLQLDYQRNPESNALISRWSILVAGVVLAAAAIHTAVDVNRDLASLESTIARGERRSIPVTRATLSAQESKRYADEIAFANTVAEQLTFPWPEVLQAVEAGMTKNVALLSLEPNVPRKLLRITAEARTKADMLAYVRRLESDKRLSNVHVIDHETRSETPGNPVRFSMQASLAAGAK